MKGLYRELKDGLIVEAAGLVVEGPGVRAAVWVQGCTLGCAECCNPELLGRDGGEFVDPVALADSFARLDIEGVTVLGGEPLQQTVAVARFLHRLRARSDKGVFLFTGYEFSTAIAKAVTREVIDLCDLVVAGPFISDLTPDERRWIGSRNQTVHFVTDRYRRLEGAWERHRDEIEIHVRCGEIVVNGSPIKPCLFG